MKIEITDIQRFCMHDGPGIRTTVFFKGCPLQCRWCHNPETQEKKPQLLYYENKCIGCGACLTCPQGAHSGTDSHKIDRELCIACGICAENCPTGALSLAGKSVSVDEIMKVVLKDTVFYGEKGGITLSGGEPMLQGEGALSLLTEAKKAGLHTAMETCGYFPESYLPALSRNVDLFLWDIKDTDKSRHQRYTGVSPERIWNNLRKLDELGSETLLRCIMIKGVNIEKEHGTGLAKLYHSLRHCRGVELLAYHPYGDSKQVALGRESCAETGWIPGKEEMATLRQFLKEQHVPVIE